MFLRNFKIKCPNNHSLDCHANQIIRAPATAPATSSNVQTAPFSTNSAPAVRPSLINLHYRSRSDKSLGLFDWVKLVVDETLSKS